MLIASFCSTRAFSTTGGGDGRFKANIVTGFCGALTSVLDCFASVLLFLFLNNSHILSICRQIQTAPIRVVTKY